MNRIITFAAAAALVAGACGKDSIVEPTYGDSCSKGTLALGDTLHGDLRLSTACFQDYDFWAEESSLYQTYKVHFDAGKAYLIREQQEADTGGVNLVDAELQLWTTDAKGTRVPVALSDDEGGSSNFHYDSELWFVAPATADFNLFAMAYDASDSGGYRVSFQPCNVVARLDSSGVYAGLSLPTSGPCLRHKIGDNPTDSTQAVLAVMQLNAQDTVTITAIADSSTFAPIMEAGGPGLDVNANIYTDSRHEYDVTGAGDTARVTFTAPATGSYSVLVGATPFGNGGALKLLFEKQPALQTVPPVPHTLKFAPGAGKLRSGR